MGEEKYKKPRERMVVEQLESRGIVDERLLAAMRAVPRHLFVPSNIRNRAYCDYPLRIGHQQTISQPYIVALMTQLLELKPEDKVLEVGTGSGYQAAILAQLVDKVYTIERIQELAERARENLAAIGLEKVKVEIGDGTRGLPEEMPFDAIVITAAAPSVPEPLKEQLADGGRLVLPAGGHGGQYLERWTRQGEIISREKLIPVAFVPLIGEYGWPSGMA